MGFRRMIVGVGLIGGGVFFLPVFHNVGLMQLLSSGELTAAMVPTAAIGVGVACGIHGVVREVQQPTDVPPWLKLAVTIFLVFLIPWGLYQAREWLKVILLTAAVGYTIFLIVQNDRR